MMTATPQLLIGPQRGMVDWSQTLGCMSYWASIEAASLFTWMAAKFGVSGTLCTARLQWTGRPLGFAQPQVKVRCRTVARLVSVGTTLDSVARTSAPAEMCTTLKNLARVMLPCAET